MSNSAIIKQVEEKQKEVQNQLVKDLYVCDICRKNKKKLYFCKWQNCAHIGRMLCKKCGRNVHEADSDDEEGEEDVANIDHEFDISASHIQEISSDTLINVNNDPKNKALVKQRIKDMQMAAHTIEEKRNSAGRKEFWDDVAFGTNAIMQLQNIPLLEYTNLFYSTWNEMCVALKAGAFKQFSSNMSSLFFEASDEMLELTKVCHEGAFAAAGVTFAAEMVYQTYHLIRGNIDGKQWGKKLLVAASGATGAAVGNIGGTAVGTAIGTLLCPGIGSSIGGAIGGLLGALFVGAKARQSVEDIKYFNDTDEQKRRMELINDALKAFQFSYKDIKNNKVFNKKTIAKKYRTRALEVHPDKSGGSYEKFHALNAQMAILLALFEHNDHIKTETAKYIKAITL